MRDQRKNTFPSPALTTQTVHGRGCALGGLQAEPFLMLNAKVLHARGTEVGVGSPQGCASWQVTCQTPSQHETWDVSAPHRNATSQPGSSADCSGLSVQLLLLPLPSKSQQKAPLVACLQAAGPFLWAGGPMVESGTLKDWHRGTWMIASEEQRG